MLEFLKDAVSNSIYERAMDCERNLKSFNSLVSMQTFFETMLKQCFLEANPNCDEHEISRMKLSEIVSNTKFCLNLKRDYPSFSSNDIYNLNKIANVDKHDLSGAKRPSAELVKMYFKLAFDFSAEYYNIHTGNKKPRWTEDEFKACLEKLDPKALERHKKENQKLKVEIQDAKTELQKILDNYQEAVYAREQLEKLRDSEQQNLMDLQEWPKCTKCKAAMIPKQNKKGEYYWACSAYKKRCEGEYQTVLPPHRVLIAKYYDIPDPESIIIPNTKASNQAIKSAHKKLVEIVADPLSYEICTPKRFLFQSLAIPQEIFDDREKFHLSKYSQFYVSASMQPKIIDAKKRTIYSMALRLLNRGIVLPADMSVSAKIKSYFKDSVNNECVPMCLSSSTIYKSPIFPCDSNREKEFALKVFPDVFGHDWANFVMSQVNLSALVLDSRKDEFSEQRVDFVVNYQNCHVVIELDGKEHLLHKGHDEARKQALEEAGYAVLRYKNEDVDNNISSIISDIKQKIENIFVEETVIPVSNKYLIACKLYHQIVIAIFKGLEQGYITENSNLKFSSTIADFKQEDYDFIFSIALEYVKEIIEAYVNIYDLDISLNLNDNNLTETKIMFGDGEENNNCILIRDCKVKEPFLCRIEPFDIDLLPKNTPTSSMRFFLRTIFGFSDFREGQLQAICRILERKDSIILLPTGAGKSVIYQLASYIVPGMIVVISPLRSLIEDQVMNLYWRCGINNAIPIYSSTQKTEEEKQKDIKKMQHNSSSLLYIAPERLQIETFSRNVKVLLEKNNVFTVAIDEAHCVSEWGHEFRAAYLDIGSSSRELFKKGAFKPSIIALTGTASEEVLKDVKRELNVEGADAIIKPKTFDRQELNFSVTKCDVENKIDTLKSILQKHLPNKFGLTFEEFAKCNGEETKSGIIFAPNRRTETYRNYAAFNIREDLHYNLPEIKSGCYFSKPPYNYDEDTWEATIKESAIQFRRNQINLLVATKAYGMGIDKSNIRYIIHSGITSSFEQYYQEAGRAARDGKNAECVIVFSNKNPKSNEKILDSTLNFQQFNTLQSENKSDDDLSKVLFFHVNSFQGSDKEIKTIEYIKSEIVNKNCVNKARVVLYLPNKYKMPYKGNETLEIEDNDWEKALVRLKRLGVIERYFYDYKGNYTVLLKEFTRESVIKAYLSYVEEFSIGRIQAEKNKFELLTDEGWNFVAKASKILIDFIYEKIESSRRIAIRAMYLLAKDVSDMPQERQNEYFHKYISRYFSSSSALDEVFNSKSDGINEIYNVLDFDPYVVYSEKERIRAADLLPTIQRLLESKAHHPGLLFLESAAYIKSQPDKKSVIVNDILSAIQYAKSEYLTSDETLFICLSRMLNLALEADYKLFNDIVKGVHKQNAISHKALLSHMLTSSDVRDENRDAVALEYVLSKFRIEKKRR